MSLKLTYAPGKVSSSKAGVAASLRPVTGGLFTAAGPAMGPPRDGWPAGSGSKRPFALQQSAEQGDAEAEDRKDSAHQCGGDKAPPQRDDQPTEECAECVGDIQRGMVEGRCQRRGIGRGIEEA